MQVIDPVCGARLEIDEVAAQEDHHGWAYFFCSARCQRSFEANPERYVGTEPQFASAVGAARADEGDGHG